MDPIWIWNPRWPNSLKKLKALILGKYRVINLSMFFFYNLLVAHLTRSTKNKTATNFFYDTSKAKINSLMVLIKWFKGQQKNEKHTKKKKNIKFSL